MPGFKWMRVPWWSSREKSQPKSQQEGYINWPLTEHPRRAMEHLGHAEIDIVPNDERIRVQPCLRARLDDKVDISQLHRDTITELETQSLSAGGEARHNGQMCPRLRATWRLSGRDYSVTENFIVVTHKPDPDFSVLLAVSDGNRNGMSRSKGSMMAPMFGTGNPKDAEQQKLEQIKASKEEIEKHRVKFDNECDKKNESTKNDPKPK